MKYAKRGKLLGISLLLTLCAVVYLWFNDRNTAEADNIVSAVSFDESRQNKQMDAQQQPNKNNVRNLSEPTQDIFSAEQKLVEPEVKPPPPPTPAPIAIVKPVSAPLPPAAPPIPFIYIGKLLEDGVIIVFLGMHGKNLAVKVGDVIQQTYRIDEIKPPLLTMTYLPMNIKQSIQIGEPN